MFRKLAIVGVVIAVIAAGVLAWQFFKPTLGASQPVADEQAIPVTAATESVAATPTEPGVVVEETPVQAEVQAGARTFLIDPGQSEARFIINEVLEGSPKTVVGITNQVRGQLIIDAGAPANSSVGVIQVNARTLTTDNEFRNRAIKNRILLTDQYEFVTFTPRSISGLPVQAGVGQELRFQITGDLTIKDVTREAVFDVVVTPLSESEIKGLATTTLRYADFGVAIPQVPMVSGVEETVLLEFEFVAMEERVN